MDVISYRLMKPCEDVYWAMLHNTYDGSRTCGFRQELFFSFYFGIYV